MTALGEGFATWPIEVLCIDNTGLGLGLGVGVVIERGKNLVANPGVSFGNTGGNTAAPDPLKVLR